MTNALLFDDHPLMCSPQLAEIFGSADEAIILQQLHYWLKRTGKLQADGHSWIYNSMADWMKQFPWIKSRKRLANYFSDLEDRKLVITGNFNKAKFDKTKWYRIDYDALNRLNDRMGQNDPIDVPKTDNRVSQNNPTNGSNRTNGMGRNDTTYTRDYTETTTEIGTGTRVPAHVNKKDNPETIKVMDAWMNVWGRPEGKTKNTIRAWVEDFGPDLVIWTFNFAKHCQVSEEPAISWMTKAFDRYLREGVTTVQQAEKSAEKHRKKVTREIKQRHARQRRKHKRAEKLPDWAKDNHPRKDDKASQDQLDESARLMAQLHAKKFPRQVN